MKGRSVKSTSKRSKKGLTNARTEPGLSQGIESSHQMPARKEESLKISDDLFLTSAECLTESLGIYSAVREKNGQIIDFRIDYVNDAACRLNMMSREEQVGRNLSELMPEFFSTPISRDFVETMLTGNKRITESEVEVTSPDGLRTIRTYDYCLNRSGNNLVVVWNDVTEGKLLASNLRENLAKYRGLFETVNEPFYINRLVYDKRGSIVDWIYEDVNPAGLEVLRVGSLGEIEGKSGAMVIGPKLLPFYIRMIEKARSSGHSETFVYNSPVSGRDFVSSFAVIGDRWIVSQLDITDVKRAQRTAEKYSAMLEQSNADLEQFAYVASHDLQEPLRMVLGYLTKIDRELQKDQDNKIRRYMRSAMEGGERMRNLIDALLEYSRIESSGKPFKHVDVNEVVKEAVSRLKIQIEESGGTVIIDPLPSVQGDDSQLIRVFQNLLSNAIQFRGQEIPQIHVSAWPCPEGWTFSVQDNGIGFGMQYSDQIFQMFQRLHAQDKYSGNGVGLAITKKIIKRHGGGIWVESEEGKGATFLFTMPRISGLAERKHLFGDIENTSRPVVPVGQLK